MLSLIEAIVGVGGYEYPRNAPAEAFQQQLAYHEELKRREKATEARVPEEFRDGVSDVKYEKASDRGAVAFSGTHSEG